MELRNKNNRDHKEEKMTEAEFIKREREIMQEEKREILRHKWLESEKAGKDIGFEKALLDWKVNHWQKWLSWFKEQMDIRDRSEKAAIGAF